MLNAPQQFDFNEFADQLIQVNKANVKATGSFVDFCKDMTDKLEGAGFSREEALGILHQVISSKR